MGKETDAKMQENRDKLLRLIKSAPREYRQSLLDELDGGEDGVSSSKLREARARIAELEEERKAGTKKADDRGNSEDRSDGGEDDDFNSFLGGL